MAIDFFKEDCKSITSDEIFGIIDSPPATLSFTKEDNWHVRIENFNKKELTHTAIDACVEIPDYEGKRCESMITYDNVLVFLEL